MPVFMLTIVRHGETDCNKEGILQGQMDTDLSEKGSLQARLVGYRLQHEKFSHVYTSDLKRAQKTCEYILEENKATKVPVVETPSLRERSFGIFQGHPRSDFIKAAKKAGYKGSHFAEFTPAGAESLSELRERAITFFHDLCHMVSKLQEEADNNTRGRCEDGEEDDKKSSASLDVTDKSCHQSSGSTSSTSGYSTEADSTERLCPLSPLDTSPAPVSPGYVFDDSCPAPRGFVPVFDSDIRSHIRGQQTLVHGCPNVSLSPIFEHRLSSMSSISSGRNSSFDDDSFSLLSADILVVSHGGLLKELLTYFARELGLKLDVSCPQNASINKFAVTVSGNELPRVSCLLNNDTDHLMQQGPHGAEALERADEIC